MTPFRLLLRLYPRDFRARFEADLVAFLGDEWAHAREAGGMLWRTRFWAQALVDALATGFRLRLRRRPSVHASRRTSMSGWLAELRHALRGFRRAPAFHILAALTFALGVAATTAVFGVLDGVVLRPLPYPDSERLVRVATRLRMSPDDPGPMSHPAVLVFDERSRLVEAVTAIEIRNLVLATPEGPELVRTGAAGPGLFDLLGARPALGRLLIPDDHEPGAPRVVVLARDAWQSRYGGASDVIGTTLRIDGVPHIVVGALGRDFVAPEAAGAGEVVFWTNLSLDPDARGSFGAFAIGRLADGATPAQATVELTGILQEFYAGDGPAFIEGAMAIDLLEATIGPVGDTLWLVLGGVGLLLLIACANVANLMLARGTDRQGEVVLRFVLGASRGGVAAHVLAHSVILALVGAALGLVIAAGALTLFRAFGPGGIPRLAEVALDWRVAAFAIGLSLLAGTLFGALPAWHAARRAPAEVLRSGGRTATASRGTRGLLIIAETAMAVVLVIASGLLLHAFARLRDVDPGYRTEDVVALQVEQRTRDVEVARMYYDRLLASVRSVPGVRSAALSAFMPYGDFAIVQRYTVEGAADGEGEAFLPTVIVSDQWTETLGTRIVAGRGFDARDVPGGTPVVLVSETLVRQFWPGATDVVGRRIKSGGLDTEDEPWYTVVGVVSDVRTNPAADPYALVYHPRTQELQRVRHTLLIHAGGGLRAIAPALRRAVREVDDGVPIRVLSDVEDLAAASLAQPRFYTTLVSAFGLVALLLALVGIYGTTAYATSRRTREIGIRLALGGVPATVAGLLVRDGVGLALAGVVLGVLAALAGSRLLESYLFGVRATDPGTFAATAVAVLATAALAAWIPARRAARLDPSSALRTDAVGGGE